MFPTFRSDEGKWVRFLSATGFLDILYGGVHKQEKEENNVWKELDVFHQFSSENMYKKYYKIDNYNSLTKN